MYYDSMETIKDQDIKFLSDISKSGKERQWKEKKMKTNVLSIIYKNLGMELGEYYISKAKRLEKCGNFLQFQIMENGLKKLINGNFCRVNLCPICGWRRSLKIYSNISKIMENMKDYQYIFLTLTIKNCKSERLDQTVTNMMKAWNKLSRYKNVLRVCKGWYRGLEITHNIKIDTYHPHFHVIIAVNKSYFKHKDYIKKSSWCDMWKKVMDLDYTPVVDIRKVKGNTAKAVSEVAKYTVKDIDYIDPEDLEMSESAVKILDEVLHKRRLIAYGGIMKELHKKLNLDDEIDGSLENISDDKENDVKSMLKVTYAWNTGYRNYVQLEF